MKTKILVLITSIISIFFLMGMGMGMNCEQVNRVNSDEYESDTIDDEQGVPGRLGSLDQCKDGWDNDGDARIDYGIPGGCAKDCEIYTDFYVYPEDCLDNCQFEPDPSCMFECTNHQGFPSEWWDTESCYYNECTDGKDNDFNGAIDEYDSTCIYTGMAYEVSACEDGLDNDWDGFTDWEDPGCYSASNWEVVPDLDEKGLNECDDGIDNDWDGLLDAMEDGGDEECDSAWGPTEWPEDEEGGGPTEPTNECNDGVDNDGDTFIDLVSGNEDPMCQAPSSQTEFSQCNDFLDNDSDGYIDILDPSCNPGGTYDPNYNTESPVDP